MNGHDTALVLHLEVSELDFILRTLGALRTVDTVQAGMIGLIPKLVQQANAGPPRSEPTPTQE